MSKFIESAESRETSPELMEAIFEVAGGDEELAEQIWENGATRSQRDQIISIVTADGSSTEDFNWGAEEDHWATADTYNE